MSEMPASMDCIYCDADSYIEKSHGQWECDFGHRFPVEISNDPADDSSSEESEASS